MPRTPRPGKTGTKAGRPARPHKRQSTTRVRRGPHPQDITHRGKRQTQKKPIKHEGPYTPAVRHDKRGRQINTNSRKEIEERTVQRWVIPSLGDSDPTAFVVKPFVASVFKTRAAAMKAIPRHLRTQYQPKLQIFKFPRFTRGFMGVIHRGSTFSARDERGGTGTTAKTAVAARSLS